MAANSQTMFSDAFSWMKKIVFWLRFHWNVSLSIQLKITSTGLDNGFAPNRWQAIIWILVDPIHCDAYILCVCVCVCVCGGGGGGGVNNFTPIRFQIIVVQPWYLIFITPQEKCYISEHIYALTIWVNICSNTDCRLFGDKPFLINSESSSIVGAPPPPPPPPPPPKKKKKKKPTKKHAHVKIESDCKTHLPQKAFKISFQSDLPLYRCI